MTTAAANGSDLLRELAGASPADALAKLASGDRWPAILGSLAEEAERLVIKDLAAALACTEALLKICDLCGEFRGRVRRARGQTLAYANRYAEAEAVLAEGIRIAEEARDDLEAAQCRLMSLHALARQGRFDDAVRMGEAAREAFLRAGRAFDAARADINIGVTLRMKDEPALAIERFDRAAPAVAAAAHIMAQVQSNRAEALLDLHRFSEAHEAFVAARTAFDAVGAARAAAIVEGNIADLFGRQGRLDEALEHFEVARRRLGEAEAPGDAARLEVERAETMLQLGLPAEAGAIFHAAMTELTSRGMVMEAARARTGLGRSLLLMRRFDAAAEELGAAITEFESLGHASGAGRAGLLRVRAFLGAGRWHDARSVLRTLEARADIRPVERVELDGLCAITLAHLGDLAAARGLIGSAIDRARTIGLPIVLAELHQNLAWMCERAGDVESALAALRDAMSMVERVRSGLRAEQHRAVFSGAFMGVYDEYARLWLDGGRDAVRALETVERARARALLDVLGAGQAFSAISSDPGDDSHLLRTRDELVARIAAAHADLRDGGGPSAARRATNAEELEAQLEDVELRLAATRRFAGDFAPPPSGEQIVRGVTRGCALIEYFWNGSEIDAFVIRDGRVDVVRGLCAAPAVEERLGALRLQVAIANSRGYSAVTPELVARAGTPLARLGEMLLEPLWHLVEGAEQLAVIADGVLACVPFQALRVGGRSLLDMVDTRSAPSAAVMMRLAGRPAAAGRRVVIGVADQLAPHAEAECRAVAEVMGAAQVLLGGNATVAEVKEALRGAGGVHIAAHARFVPHSPMQSAIKLADGWLTARDLYGIELSGGTVVLSACDTGRTAMTHGREVLGLLRAFMSAGAGSLVLSHWPLHDETAAQLLADMYDSWYRDPAFAGCPATALREAQRRARDRTPHVAAWGSLYMVGGWNRGVS